MHHPILLLLLGAFVLSRILRHHHRRCAWGGCGGRCSRRFGGPIDLGAPDGDADGRFRRRQAQFRRWSRRWRAEASTSRAAPSDVPGALELNQRQRELYDEVMERAKAQLSVEDLAETLAAVGREPFDRAAVEATVQSRDLVDDLEHLHHSLTPEQRARLRQVASA